MQPHIDKCFQIPIRRKVGRHLKVDQRQLHFAIARRDTARRSLYCGLIPESRCHGPAQSLRSAGERASLERDPHQLAAVIEMDAFVRHAIRKSLLRERPERGIYVYNSDRALELNADPPPRHL